MCASGSSGLLVSHVFINISEYSNKIICTSYRWVKVLSLGIDLVPIWLIISNWHMGNVYRYTAYFSTKILLFLFYLFIQMDLQKLNLHSSLLNKSTMSWIWCFGCLSGPLGFTCWILLLRYSVLSTVESLSLLYLLLNLDLYVLGDDALIS